MNKKQAKVFEQLLNDKDFKGKEQLEHLLWLNTSKPKYKVGDCVWVTNRLRKLYGQEVADFKGRVAEVYSFDNSNEWHYRVEMIVLVDDKQTVVNEYALESDIESGAFGNINIIKRISGGI